MGAKVRSGSAHLRQWGRTLLQEESGDLAKKNTSQRQSDFRWLQEDRGLMVHFWG